MAINPGAAGGFLQGFGSGLQGGIQLRRQRMLDDLAYKKMEQEAEYRRKAQEIQEAQLKRQQDHDAATLEVSRGNLEVNRAEEGRQKATADAAARKSAIDAWLSPADAFQKDSRVAEVTAKDYNELRGYAALSPESVTSNDPVLAAEKNRLLDSMKASADAARGAQAKERREMAGIRASGVQDRYDSTQRERLAKVATPFARMKPDVELLNKAVAEGQTGFGYDDSLKYPSPELRASMKAKAVQHRRAINNVFNMLLREGAGLAQTETERANQLKGRLLADRLTERDFTLAWRDFTRELEGWQQAALGGFPEPLVKDYLENVKNGRIGRLVDTNLRIPMDARIEELTDEGLSADEIDKILESEGY